MPHFLEVPPPPGSTPTSWKYRQDCKQFVSELGGDLPYDRTMQADTGSVAPPAADLTVCDLIERQAARLPYKTAVIDGPQHTTYAALLAAADRRAQFLEARGVEPGALIGIAMERSLEMVLWVLAILKAGAAYVPLIEGTQRIACALSWRMPGCASRSSMHRSMHQSVQRFCTRRHSRRHTCRETCTRMGRRSAAGADRRAGGWGCQ